MAWRQGLLAYQMAASPTAQQHGALAAALATVPAFRNLVATIEQAPTWREAVSAAVCKSPPLAPFTFDALSEVLDRAAAWEASAAALQWYAKRYPAAVLASRVEGHLRLERRHCSDETTSNPYRVTMALQLALDCARRSQRTPAHLSEKLRVVAVRIICESHHAGWHVALRSLADLVAGQHQVRGAEREGCDSPLLVQEVVHLARRCLRTRLWCDGLQLLSRHETVIRKALASPSDVATGNYALDLLLQLAALVPYGNKPPSTNDQAYLRWEAEQREHSAASALRHSITIGDARATKIAACCTWVGALAVVRRESLRAGSAPSIPCFCAVIDADGPWMAALWAFSVMRSDAGPKSSPWWEGYVEVTSYERRFCIKSPDLSRAAAAKQNVASFHIDRMMLRALKCMDRYGEPPPMELQWMLHRVALSRPRVREQAVKRL